MLEVLVGPAQDDAAAAFRHVLREWDEPIDEVAELMSRFTTTDAEIAATVHFAWKGLSDRHNGPPNEGSLVSEVMDWKLRRRPPLDERAVASTSERLLLHSPAAAS